MNTITPFMKAPLLQASGNAYSKVKMASRNMKDLSEIKKQLVEMRRTGQELKPQTAARQTMKTTVMDSILNSEKAYGESIRTNRQQARSTATEKKKFNYHFKNLSSQILRSKTSTSARQVVSMAMREVMRLKREKQSGKYNAEEVEAAILHAEAMERVARKKVKHLEQEELVKASGKAAPETEIKEAEPEEEGRSAKEAEQTAENEETARGEEASEEAGVSDTVNRYLQEDMPADLNELTGEMLKEISSALQEMMEELGVEDEEVLSPEEMTPEDLKEVQIRHRNKEMKEIVKADAEYLKAVFDELERQKNAGGPDLKQAGDGAVDLSGSGASFGSGSAEGMAGPATTEGAAVDVAL